MFACDDSFASPILFMCLAKMGVSGEGTPRSALRGASDAKAWFTEHTTELTSNVVLRERARMILVRFRDVAFTLRNFSKDVLSISTFHIYQKYFRGFKHR